MRSHRRRPSGSAAVVSKHHRVSCLIWIFQLASDVLHWQPERLAWGTTVVKMIRRGAAILAVLALAACGGGASLGDDGSGGSLGGGTGTGGSDSTDYQVGNSASGSFSKGAIAVGATMLVAGGSTGMAVDIVDKEGNLAPGPSASILFSPRCLASGTRSEKRRVGKEGVRSCK